LVVGCKRSDPPQPSAKHSSDDLRKLTVTQVAERINLHDGKLAIYDSNTKEQFSAAHLPGARWVESHSVTAAVLPPDKTTVLVFYCYNEA
jgi:hypothetical protein